MKKPGHIEDAHIFAVVSSMIFVSWGYYEGIQQHFDKFWKDCIASLGYR